MNFDIIGYGDKRPIVYPLLYVLNFLGSTILVTDDTDFVRLLPGNGFIGQVGNTQVFIVPDIGAVNVSDYEHVVYVAFEKTRCEDCHTIYTVQDSSPLKPFYKVPAEGDKIVQIGYEASKEKDRRFIMLEETLLREMYRVENLSRLMPVKNKKLLNVLASLFADSFGRDIKAMKKLLCYKGGKLT